MRLKILSILLVCFSACAEDAWLPTEAEYKDIEVKIADYEKTGDPKLKDLATHAVSDLGIRLSRNKKLSEMSLMDWKSCIVASEKLLDYYNGIAKWKPNGHVGWWERWTVWAGYAKDKRDFWERFTYGIKNKDAVTIGGHKKEAFAQAIYNFVHRHQEGFPTAKDRAVFAAQMAVAFPKMDVAVQALPERFATEAKSGVKPKIEVEKGAYDD